MLIAIRIIIPRMSTRIQLPLPNGVLSPGGACFQVRAKGLPDSIRILEMPDARIRSKTSTPVQFRLHPSCTCSRVQPWGSPNDYTTRNQSTGFTLNNFSADSQSSIRFCSQTVSTKINCICTKVKVYQRNQYHLFQIRGVFKIRR